ncbi:hypothetical protein, partial [Xanthomonas perforans]|uniref:hypothetical protein n=1 Tax=Xanthomonas perforans TaxID=442694 RepID=UPI00069BA8D3
MPLKPDSFVIARATDLLPGAIFTTGGNWFMHALVFRNYAPAHAAVALTFKGGPIQGPGTPPPASIAWTDAAEPVIVAAESLITLAGAESSTVNRFDGFYATHWGVWVLDAEG